MIEMHIKSGIPVPTIVCDICGEEISCVNKAAAVYSNDQANGSKLLVMLTHKGIPEARNCHTEAVALLKADNGPEPSSMELRLFLINLSRNAVNA